MLCVSILRPRFPTSLPTNSADEAEIVRALEEEHEIASKIRKRLEADSVALESTASGDLHGASELEGGEGAPL